MNILLTDGGYKHTLAALRSLSKSGHNVFVVGGAFDQACLSRHCKKSYSPDHFAYYGNRLESHDLELLINFVTQNQIDLIIPIGGDSVKFFVENRRSFLAITNVLLPNDEAVSLCFDKQKSAEFVSDLGINVPKSYSFASVLEVEDNLEKIRFPVVTKAANELQVLPTSYFERAKDLLTYLKKNEALRINQSLTFPIIQERIHGNGEGYFALYRNGKEIAYFMHKRVRELPSTGGSSTCAESIYEEDLLSAGRLILSSLNWNGVAMVEFKRCDRDKTLYFMEVNPKFWGSLDLSISAGVDFPSLLPQSLEEHIFHGTKTGYLQPYKTNVKFSWPFEGDLQHAIVNPSNVSNVIADLLNPKVKTNLYVTDPLPFALNFTKLCIFIIRILLSRLGIATLYYRSRRFGLLMGLYKTISEKTGFQMARFCRITEFLYLGCEPKPRSLKQLSRWGIDAILDLRFERESGTDPDNGFLNYHVPALEYLPLSNEEIYKGLAIIQNEVRRGRKIFVHCREGVGRAAMLVLIYLCKEGLSFDEAEVLLRRKRPIVNLNEEQRQAALDFVFTEFFK